MELSIERIELLLLIAAVVAMIARRFRTPYSVGLVLAGIGLAMLTRTREIELTKELIFTAFLPPLVFEATLNIRWPDLRKDLPVIVSFATLGVVLSAAVTTLGMHFLAGWDWSSAALFGTLIAATDPVSVIATLKDGGVHGRLRLLMEAESLFNDSTAAIAFGLAMLLAAGGDITVLGVTQSLLANVLGGVVCGAVVAGAALLLAGRTTDHLIEITFTTVAAYGSFLLAEHFHFSGVLATLTAGLMIGNLGHLGPISSRGRVAVISFWEYAAFVANSLIFILIGIREANQNFLNVLVPAVFAIILVTLGRAVAIYPIAALFSRSDRWRIQRSHQHLLFWGGLRGALALALALGLPLQTAQRDEIITVAFAVVAFSIFVQGLTMMPLLQRLGEIPKSQSVTANTKN